MKTIAQPRRPVSSVGVLLAGSPFMAMMFAALGPILPLLADHFGGAFGAQMIMTAPAIGVVVGGLLAGFAVDRFGPRPVLLIGLLGYGLAGTAGLYLSSLPVLLATRFVLGLAMAHTATAIGVLVGGWFAGLSRARFLGYQAGVAGVSALTFLILSGVLAEKIGWRAPFALYGLAPLVFLWALVTIRSAEMPPRAERVAAPRGALRGLWRIYALGMFLFVGYFMTSIQLSFLLAADGVNSPIQRSLLIAGGVLAGGVCGASYGAVLTRLGGRWTQFLLAGLLGGGIVMIGLASSLPVVAIGAVLAGGGGGMSPPHIETLLLGRASLEVRARAVSFMFTALYIADFLNPLLLAPLRGLVGIHSSFLIVGVVIVVVAALLATRPAPPMTQTH